MADADKSVRDGDLTGGAVNGEVRSVSDVETLKALADPTRLAILSALMRGLGEELPVMSAKELAAELNQPQTKLYRHIKHLEGVGLIRSVSSRVVSGIVEHRYQACQNDLMLGAGLTDTEKASKDTEATVAAAFDLYRRQFFASHRAGLISQDEPAQRQPHQRAVLGMSAARVPASRAAAIHQELQRILDEVGQSATAEEAGEDAVTINVLVGYFSPVQTAATAAEDP